MSTLRIALVWSFISLSSLSSVASRRLNCEEEWDDGILEFDCHNDDDDDGLSTEAIIGLAVGLLAVLIAVPVLLCFCCSCFCFKKTTAAPKTKTIVVVAPPTQRSDINGNRIDIKIPMDNSSAAFNSEGYRERELPPYSNIDLSEEPTAPKLMMATDEDPNGFYYLGLSNQPPPPYPFPIPVSEHEQYPYNGSEQFKSHTLYSEPEPGDSFQMRRMD